MPHEEDAKIVFLTNVYGHYKPQGEVVELDLGCGSGSYTCQLAKLYPQSTVLGADVMVGRLRKVVRRAERCGADNLTVLRVEARSLLAKMLPDNSVDRIHLLCPDPWPKGRHRGNRLLASNFVTFLHRVLKENGVFHFSSDDEYYCGAVDRVISGSKLFEVADETIADLKGIRSDFEERWLAEGKTVLHRAWRRLPLPPHTIGH